MASGPYFVRFFPYVINALRQLGNSGVPSEVYELVARDASISEEELSQQTKNKGSRFENQVAWAKFYLAKAGYIDSSKRGVWSLTEAGANAHLAEHDSLEIFRAIQQQFKGKTPNEHTGNSVRFDEQPAPTGSAIADDDYRTELINLLRGLPPSGFERLCQRLLRESGFQQVEVTGQTGDGGIDGRGLLQINPLLSIQVVFQCKRYRADNPVTSSQIRDLRGSMAGRTDKGIFITTSYFTSDAKKEALREGVPPIELVDGEKMVLMFETLELGLIPKTTFELDTKFFEEFAQ